MLIITTENYSKELMAGGHPKRQYGHMEHLLQLNTYLFSCSGEQNSSKDEHFMGAKSGQAGRESKQYELFGNDQKKCFN